MHPLDVKAGDRVLFGKWSGTEVKIDGEEVMIMKESDVMGIVDSGVKAGEKMHQRAGVKLHQDGMPKASIGGLLLGDKQDEKRIASPENVTQASSVASPPMFPLPH